MKIDLPDDKKLNFFCAVGINRAEMNGANINNISRYSKYDLNDKLSTAYLTKSTDKIMHANSGHFVEPDFEPSYVPTASIKIPKNLRGKALYKVEKYLKQYQEKDGDKTLSAINFLCNTCRDLETTLYQGCKLRCLFTLIF